MAESPLTSERGLPAASESQRIILFGFMVLLPSMLCRIYVLPPSGVSPLLHIPVTILSPVAAPKTCEIPARGLYSQSTDRMISRPRTGGDTHTGGEVISFRDTFKCRRAASLWRTASLAALLLAAHPPVSVCQDAPLPKTLEGFDAYMETVLKDWNVPGAGVGIIVKGKVVLAKGYGYRDYGKKLPVTANTLYQIASNTKLFTVMAVGLLVAEGKLEWDRPVRNYVPAIRFYDDGLNNTVTVRDMLSHRTGISRHDLIWFKSDFTRKELFDRLRYLEPSQPLRQGFLYNNMMYASAGYALELITGKTWEDFVSENIFTPLGMTSTIFSAKEMVSRPDYAVPYDEKRDTTTLYEIPVYEEGKGLGPAGSIISNVHDMSCWLTMLMNGGAFGGNQVIPPEVVRASLSPSVAMTNSALENRGFAELLNPVYGMGRWFASYRGHYLTYHGGDLPGFHSQVSCMPYDSIGVVVFVIGDHAAPLYNIISYNVYERLLGLDQTPWSRRGLDDRIKGKLAGKEARSKAGAGRVAGTQPSHPLADYAGEFGNPAYGVMSVALKDTSLWMDFHHMVLPLRHFHYDRFDTPDDEQYGLWSLNYLTSPQGDIDRIVTSLDEGEVTFVRRPDAALADPQLLARYTGKYVLAGGTVEILVVDGTLYLAEPGSPKMQLIPWKTGKFRVKEFSDLVVAFVTESGRVVAMKQIDPSGESRYERKQ
jgi:CubicO group peptidase (beta-lactamase class C family)